MLTCKKCHRENQDHFQFCLGCGATLKDSTVAPALKEAQAASRPTQVRACPGCGTLVPNDFAFCGKCGERLDGQIEETALKHVNLKAVPEAAASDGQLVLIRPDGSDAGGHKLSTGANIIGRGLGSIFDTDGYLSPRHAELTLTADGLRVADLGSMNGVFFKITGEEEISNGDQFRVGQQLLRFEVLPPAKIALDGTAILGAPNPGYFGRLALMVGPDQIGAAYLLSGESTTIGRERGNILFSDDGYVSGQHARVSRRVGRYYLEDLKSSNGTFLRVNAPRTVASGAHLLMGQQLFRTSFA